MLVWNDILAALGLLSRLPLPAHQSRGAAGAWAWPVAGLVLGAIAGLCGAALLGLGLAPGAAAVLSLLVAVMLTGALHEDGLADLADGAWGGATVARRLEIMKDSRIGAYGVIAIVLALLARWTALSGLFGLGALPGLMSMMAAGALSRGLVCVVMALMPPARPNGLSRAVGVPPVPAAALALLIGLIAMVLAPGARLAAILAAGLAVLIVARIAKEKLGGQTGDVLGAVQQVSETAILLVLMPG